jgi:hypothetical protein
MKPIFLNLFMNILPRERVVQIEKPKQAAFDAQTFSRLSYLCSNAGFGMAYGIYFSIGLPARKQKQICSQMDGFPPPCLLMWCS